MDTVQGPDATGAVAPNQHSALVTVTLAANAPDGIGEDLVAQLAAAEPAGFQYLPFGENTADAVYNALGEDTLMRGEVIGISVALAILVVVFGALVAAGIPPAQVAGLVVDAIREEKFYILPHPHLKEHVRLRMEDILAERNPTPGVFA